MKKRRYGKVKIVFTLLILLLVLVGCKGNKTVPLDAPTGLKAVAGDGEVKLTWTAVTEALSYKVFKSTIAGEQYVLAKTVNGVSVTIDGLTNGTAYYFVVKAVNADGESSYSAEVTATPETPVGTALLEYDSGTTDFGLVHLNASTEYNDLTVINNGDTQIQLTGNPKVIIFGEDADHFTLIQPDADYLPVGDTATFRVRFTPSSGGVKEATVEILYRAEGESTDSTLTFSIQGTGNSWEFVGGREFTPAMDAGGRAEGSPDYIDLEVHDGTLYFAFKDQTNPGSGVEKNGMGLGRATVMSYSGTEWSVLSGYEASDEAAFWPSLYIYEDGTPYLAYTDRDMDAGGATVKNFGGGTWTAVGTPEFTKVYQDDANGDLGNGAYSDIFVYNDNGNPTPYVVVQEEINHTCVAAVYRFVDTYLWEPVGTKGFGGTNDPWIRVVEENGVAVPYVANVDQGVKKFDGQDWVNVGNEAFGFIMAMEMDTTGTEPVPYIAVLTGDYKLAVKQFNGTSWEDVGSSGISKGTASNVSMAMEDGVPYVAFSDYVEGSHSKLRVMKYTGQGETGWENVGNDDLTIGEEIFQTRLAVEGGIPYVAFQFPTSDFAAENSGKGSVMRYVP